MALPFLLSDVLRSKTEKQKLEQMLVDGEKQRRLSEENIEAINRKCHDLKYQVAVLRRLAEGGDNTAAYSKAGDALEKDVMIYDAIAKTGYGGIDILLTEKSLLCEKRDIVFTYMIDGEKLKFMDEVDLYILLGNALDNAIEAVTDIEKEHRINSPQRGQPQQHDNDFAGELLQNAAADCGRLPKRPKRTAQPRVRIKSIISIAEKYGGTVQVFGGK